MFVCQTYTQVTASLRRVSHVNTVILVFLHAYHTMNALMYPQDDITWIRQKKKKSCLVVLHRPPLSFENWKKVVLYKSTPRLIFRIQKRGFFSLRIFIF